MQEQIAILIEAQQGADEATAYNAGFDCAKNGANTENCHFRYFSRPSMTAAWEHGKHDGEQANGTKLTGAPHNEHGEANAD